MTNESHAVGTWWGSPGRGGASAPGRDGLMPALLLSAAAAPVASAQDQPAHARGKELYDKWYAECHGDAGAGDGAAATHMLPRPRDFTGAVFQVRTTASGELATDDDPRPVI